MNVKNLKDNYPKLITFMEDSGYSEIYVNRIYREIKRILAEADSRGWGSYNDVYLEYTRKSGSPSYLRDKRAQLGLIEHFDIYGLYPNGQRRQEIVPRGKYHLLVADFKSVIDYYCIAENKRGKKESTIYVESSNAATFLFEMQQRGFDTLEKITEEAVLAVFLTPEGSLRRSCSYKKNIAAVLKACMPQAPETFTRILAFLPALRERRKNIQYLLPEEISRLKQLLADDGSPISYRDRAVGVLALYTGLRCCDIAGLTVASIDWENDLIQISQQKTAVPIELPLTATVGNAIYDYMSLERPVTGCEYIFVSEHRPYRRMQSSSLGNISSKIMVAADIRQSDGDRRGFHIFRHHLSTELLGNKVPRPVISRILGHESPDSLDSYLGADFRHLKECAISIERFRMPEVLCNA